MNTRRMNRLEELGRVDAEKAFTKKGARNLKDEKKRIVRELKADGGRAKMPMKKAKDTRDPQFTKKGLRPVKPSQRGLRKLPTKVRNKMGYMKDGGSVALKSPDKVKIQIKKGPGKPKGKRRSYQEVRRDRGMGKALRGGGCVR